MIKKYLLNKINKAHQDSMDYMNDVIKEYWQTRNKKPIKILDVGIGEGKPTTKILKGINNADVFGVDIIDRCKYKEYKVIEVDIEKEDVPFEDEYFDVVFSHQVIEHLILKNEFIKKCQKVLKSDGLFITATENISSLDNIISLLLGQEPLNQHSSGTGKRINTFLSPRYGHDLIEDGYVPEHGHKNLPSYFSLIRMTKQNEFKKVHMSSFGGIIWPIDVLFPFYNRILVVKAYKK